MGLDHHVTIRLNSPVAATLAVPTTASFTVSQRPRMTLCVQARRWVPFSSSRVIRGAPQNAPMRAGTATSAVPISSSSPSTLLMLMLTCRQFAEVTQAAWARSYTS